MTLAVLAQRGGERIGLIGAPFAAGHTHATLGRIASALAAANIRGLPAHARLNRFSSAVLVSDFLEPVGDARREAHVHLEPGSEGTSDADRRSC